jgi:hypothetical protein
VTGFAAAAGAGVCGFVILGVFIASGQAHLFALGAVLTGLGCAALFGIVRVTRRVRWRELIGVAAAVDLLGSIFARWW